MWMKVELQSVVCRPAGRAERREKKNQTSRKKHASQANVMRNSKESFFAWRSCCRKWIISEWMWMVMVWWRTIRPSAKSKFWCAKLLFDSASTSRQLVGSLDCDTYDYESYTSTGNDYAKSGENLPYCTLRMESSNKFDESPIVMIWQNKNCGTGNDGIITTTTKPIGQSWKRLTASCSMWKEWNPKSSSHSTQTSKWSYSILVFRTSAAVKMTEKMKKNENRFLATSCS